MEKASPLSTLLTHGLDQIPSPPPETYNIADTTWDTDRGDTQSYVCSKASFRDSVSV